MLQRTRRKYLNTILLVIKIAMFFLSNKRLFHRRSKGYAPKKTMTKRRKAKGSNQFEKNKKVEQKKGVSRRFILSILLIQNIQQRKPSKYTINEITLFMLEV